jgi:hypothetical protein
MKAMMGICIVYGYEEYAYTMVDDMIRQSIGVDDHAALQNIVNFDIDEFISYYNSECDDDCKLLPDHPDTTYWIDEDLLVQPSWLIYCDLEFDSYVRRCNYHNTNDCKAILLRWKHDKFPNDENEEMKL